METASSTWMSFAMMIAIPKVHNLGVENAPIPQDVGLLMGALDLDNSGGIDYTEFRSWVVSNRDLSEEDRTEIISQSEEMRRMDWFAGAVADIAREEAEYSEERERVIAWEEDYEGESDDTMLEDYGEDKGRTTDGREGTG